MYNKLNTSLLLIVFPNSSTPPHATTKELKEETA
jgi:hypothetical protein